MVALKKSPTVLALPAWLPNWKNKEEYVDHDSPYRWAWEFLRRNHKYIADFEYFDSVPWFWPEGGKTPKMSGRSGNDDSPMIYFHSNPPGLERETLGEYKRRTNHEGKYVNLEQHYMEEWGIWPICNPADIPTVIMPAREVLGTPPLTPPFEMTCEHSAMWAAPNPARHRWAHSDAVITSLNARMVMRWDEEDGPAPNLRSDDYVFYAFDLRRDPKEQAEIVCRELTAERMRRIMTGVQPKAVKQKGGVQWKKPGHLINYLRAYDATICGVTDKKEIAKCLFGITDRPRVERVGRLINEAGKLVVGGYKALLE